MIRFDRVWRYNAATSDYTDFTDAQNVDSAITFMQAVGDYVYLGLARRAVGFMYELSTTGSYTSLAIEYYADSGGWKKCVLSSPTLLNLPAGYCLWLVRNDMTLKEFTTTFPHTASLPESGVSLFWYRIKASAFTTAAIALKLRAIPYVMYTNADDVANLMQMKNGFDYKNSPTVFAVEDRIRQKEARIDYLTKKSWRFNTVVDQEYPFNINGIKLQGWPIIDVYSLSIWNGGTWEYKINDRSSDFFTIDQWGFVKFSRFFALPARFAYIPPGLGRWDFGEFSFPVHISYSWGRNPEIDQQFGQAGEVAAQLAASDLYTAFDKTIYTRSGIDKVTYDRKIEKWTEDAEMKLDELRSIFSEGD